MFHRTSKPLGRLLSLFDDVLGDAFEEAAPHPHRRPLRWQYQRRPGTIPAQPAHCISPVRTGTPERRRQPSASR